MPCPWLLSMLIIILICYLGKLWLITQLISLSKSLLFPSGKVLCYIVLLLRMLIKINFFLSTLRNMTEMMLKNNVLAFIGPDDRCKNEALVSSAWNIPMISYVSILYSNSIFYFYPFEC